MVFRLLPSLLMIITNIIVTTRIPWYAVYVRVTVSSSPHISIIKQHYHDLIHIDIISHILFLSFGLYLSLSLSLSLSRFRFLFYNFIFILLFFIISYQHFTASLSLSSAFFFRFSDFQLLYRQTHTNTHIYMSDRL